MELQEQPEPLDLFERVLSRENMAMAWQQVKANKGAAGVDGMTIDDFPEFAREHWERIREELRTGRYRPQAVRRVLIPKASGGERPLGIATVVDRVIQQAIAQVLSPIFEPEFSENSFGFRPGRSAHDAIRSVEQGYKEGYREAVDCDLKSFFDTVKQDYLMYRLGRKVKDKRLLALIGKFLRAGVQLPTGDWKPTLEGVPQGSPLSPLLANVLLDELDKELERRGHRFARYGDDFIILVRSRWAASRVMKSITRFVEERLKLVVNVEKSRCAKLIHCSFLGFFLSRGKVKWTEKSLLAFKARIREITKRNWGVSMKHRLEELRRYMIGWINYYGISHSYAEVLALDRWIRRRVRLCYWKMWGRPRKRRKMLLKLGIDPEEVHLASRSRKGYWRMSTNSLVQRALTNAWLESQGVPSLRTRWIAIHYPDQATKGGSVRN